MRAVVLESRGGPDVLRVQEVPEPSPGDDEVLIDVVATAVNRADLYWREGLTERSHRRLAIPGGEVAGRVIDIGRCVRGVRVGDEVMAVLPQHGGYAERVAVQASLTAPPPATVSLEDAAAIPTSWTAAHDALVAQGALSVGQRVLIHAGASGLGTAAIQLAKAGGATVVATASAGKVEQCTGLGADLAIARSETDFVEEVLSFTAGTGVDLVLDVVGGDYLRRNLRALAPGGRIVQLGALAGSEAMLDAAQLAVKRASVVGATMSSRSLDQRIAAWRALRREVLPLFEAGRVRPVIDARYPLASIADAHRRLEANENVGKVVISMREPGEVIPAAAGGRSEGRR